MSSFTFSSVWHFGGDKAFQPGSFRDLHASYLASSNVFRTKMFLPQITCTTAKDRGLEGLDVIACTGGRQWNEMCSRRHGGQARAVIEGHVSSTCHEIMKLRAQQFRDLHARTLPRQNAKIFVSRITTADAMDQKRYKGSCSHAEYTGCRYAVS